MIFSRNKDTGHQKIDTVLTQSGHFGCHYESNSPAAVHNWLNRRNQKIRRVSAKWSNDISKFKTQWNGSKLVVVCHVYFLDLVDQLLEKIVNIPIEFDVLITNASGQPVIEKFESRLNGVRVLELMVDNHGRDILPLFHLINSGLLEPYELVLKLHTKKSVWRAEHDQFNDDGESWSNRLLDDLAGSTTQVQKILNSFASNPTIGVVTADGSALNGEFWGDNQATTAQLLWRLQMHLEDRELTFAAGSMYWCRAFLLKALYALELQSLDFEEEAGQVNSTTAHAVERLLGILTDEAGYKTVEVSDCSYQQGWSKYSADSPVELIARAVPFYLPQFHRVHENDEWWGLGFTEWSNVTAAKPNFLGHNQPFLPSELGYYDLSSDSIRQQQWELAEAHGISGFMYYYYWFAGKKLLEKPIEALLDSDVESPFCIMWANENWTRSWDGGSKDVLLGQDYDLHPASEFMMDILPLLRDQRYFRIEGKPVVAVYRVTQIPDLKSTVEEWRSIARREGIGEIHLLACDLGSVMHGIDGQPEKYGLDGVLEFPPHNHYWSMGELDMRAMFESFEGRVMSYKQTERRAEWKLFRQRVEKWRYPGIMVNFDNTARRQDDSDTWIGSNPYTFHRWLRAAVLALSDRPFSERVIFINAWNEWAESAVLEPSVRWGRTYLQAIESAVTQ